MNVTIHEESGENMNSAIYEESTLSIVAETSSSEEEEEEEFVPATVARVPVYKTLGLGSRALLRVDKPKSSKKGPLRPASSFYLGLPLRDKNSSMDENIMKQPVCVRELFTRSPGEKRKWETSPSAGTPTVTSTPYFSCYYTPQVGISGSTLASFSSAASFSPKSTPGDSPWSVGQRSRKRRLGLNGPMIIGVSCLQGIERLPAVEEGREEKKNVVVNGLMEYVEDENIKKEKMEAENKEAI